MTDIIWADRADTGAIVDHLVRAIVRRRRPRLAVPGGRTPIPILGELALRDLPWQDLSVTLTDDRLVANDHPASNYGLLSRTLGSTGAQLRPLDTITRVAPFDLVWVGMGKDGHVASVFPNAADALEEGRVGVLTRPDPLPVEAPFDRVTLTIEALADTSDTIIVIAGHEKRALLEEVIRHGSMLPIGRLLARRKGPVTIYWNSQ